MKTRIPADEPDRRHRSLVLLLGVVVAGSSWQIASRTGLAERTQTTRRDQTLVVERSAAPKAPTAPIDFTSRLGLARPGAQTRRPPIGWMQKPIKPASRVPIAMSSFTTPAAPRDAVSEVRSEPIARVHHSDNARVAGSPPHPPNAMNAAAPAGADRVSTPSTRAGWRIPEPEQELAVTNDDEEEDEDVLDAEEDDSEDEDTEEIEPVAAPGDEISGEPGHMPAHAAQMLIIGPATTSRGEVTTYSISLENATDVAHAPLRLVYDPAVLELVSAQEGTFFSSDGTATRFLARAGTAPGVLDISISRIPPARGIDGGGVLATVTFLARSAGSSPVVLAGSRLLDSRGRKLEYSRNDADIAVK